MNNPSIQFEEEKLAATAECTHTAKPHHYAWVRVLWRVIEMDED